MAARAMWKARLLIGGERVPVKLYAAIEDSSVHFRLLHEPDREPIRQRLVDAESGEPIDSGDTRRAWVMDSGEWVILSPDELDALEPEASRDIEVVQFVPRRSVPEPLYDRSYYLGPDGDETAWASLAKALDDAKRVGIAVWTMRGKRYRGVLTVHEERPVLVSLRAPETLVHADTLAAPKGRDLDEKELAMARQLIGLLEGEFDPREFHDDYRDRVLTLIETKRKGGKVARRKIRPKRESEDLTEALTASLEGARKRA